ncbi:hypothetical protein QJQ45_005421 [Haematococcus lacustris]|nr:hypothetical protein QJQ45_005421 [Haematococcus lacustris]
MSTIDETSLAVLKPCKGWTSIEQGTFITHVSAPWTVSVPASAASPLANLAVLNLHSPGSSRPAPPADNGGAALVYGQVWQSWRAAYASGEAAERAVRDAWSMLWELVGTPNRAIDARRNSSLVVPGPRHAAATLVAASTAANATLKAVDGLVAAVDGLVAAVAAFPGGRDAPGPRAASLAGQSLLVAANLAASGASSALAAAAALDANLDSLVTVTAAQQAAAYATMAHNFAKRFGNAMLTPDVTASFPPPVAAGAAGAVHAVAKAAAEAGAAAQEAFKTAGSGSLQNVVAAARVAAAAAASAVSQALAIAMSLQAVAGPPDQPVRIQSRGDINATAETRRVATSMAQAMAAATSCGSAAIAVMASAALVAQEVLPSASTRVLNANMSATPAGLEHGAVLLMAQRAAAEANATSTTALGGVTVATNPNTNLSLGPSPSFTAFDGVYNTVKAARGMQWAWDTATWKRSISVRMDEFFYTSGFTWPLPEPVAIISAPTSSCPARLVAVREASELPAFKDGSTLGVASYFDNSTGVVTPQGVVWLDTSGSEGNASILPGVLPSVPPTTPVDTSIIQGLTGCPLGTDLDRLMRIAAAYTSVAACNSSSNSSSSDLPWRPVSGRLGTGLLMLML